MLKNNHQEYKKALDEAKLEAAWDNLDDAAKQKILQQEELYDELVDWEHLSDYAGSGIEDLFAGARKRAIARFGKEAEDLIYTKFKKDEGAAAEIIDYFGQEGLNALKKVNNIQDAASELIRGKIGYRHIGSTANYLNEIKKTGIIPARTGKDLTYFSLDKIDDPIIAIDKMQLNKAGTDAIWRAEFETTQLINNTKFPLGKWNNSDYIEILTRSYPNFGSGGVSQFITQSEIKIKRLVNLTTGEIINF